MPQEWITELGILVGRGNRLEEAGRIGEQFAARYGAAAAESLFSARFDRNRGDTLVIVTSDELRRFFRKRPGWMEWYPGEPYPDETLEGEDDG